MDRSEMQKCAAAMLKLLRGSEENQILDDHIPAIIGERKKNPNDPEKEILSSTARVDAAQRSSLS